MEAGENQWGSRRDDFYAEEKGQSENEEDEEYNEIMKLQEIRAKKMKLAQTTQVAAINVLGTF